MNIHTRSFVASLLCIAALGAAAPSALAQDAYPNRPVKLIVPFPAGSLVDVLGRSIAENLQGSLKQAFIIDNRAGASTLLGAKVVAAAAPDGYTLIVPTVTTLSLAPQLLSSPGIDPVTDLTPIARLGATNFFLSVVPGFPARNMKEWIAVIKANPGKYSYASSGSGSPHHIFMELLKKQLGLDIVHIPYKGSSSSMTDLLSEKVDMAFLDGTLAIPNIKAGKLFAVGTSMAKRSVLMPGVPPIADTVPGYDWSGWIAFGGPAHMPAAVVATLNGEIRKMQATPAYSQLLDRAAMEPTEPLNPAQMQEFVRTEYLRWGPAIKASGAKID
ncbi:MAG: tripartite tricarboxylate transporter substrate binding protein [Burkholderiaceae bacterium]|nr:tripartite tricarboxylate transporter substrate binding protein [Burkholderiaceae bacterium]